MGTEISTVKFSGLLSVGGRKTGVIAAGMPWRRDVWVSMGEPSCGMMSVTVQLWWRTSFLASSMNGMRWPRSPGGGNKAML